MIQQQFPVNVPGGGTKVLTRKQFYGADAGQYRTLYRGRVFQIQEKGLRAAVERLKQLREAAADMTPVFENVLVYFKNITRGNFDARLSPDAIPVRWAKLSKKYSDWKYRYLHNIMPRGLNQKRSKTKIWYKSKADLVLSGNLKNAVYGGAGWEEEITPTEMSFGIRGIPYAAAHQFGYPKRNLPARPYMLTKEGNLPKPVMNYLVDQIIDYLKGAA